MASGAPPESPRDTLKAALANAARRLGDRSEAARLASLALDRPLSWIMAHPEAPLDPDVRMRFAELTARRAAGVPFAYLAGRREFYGREFSVSPAALIPRPETEHLVEWALELPLPGNARVADVGTGSGCIVLTLAAEKPTWRCTGIDLSREALAVATINRARMDRNDVALLEGDLLAPVGGRSFDLIVSNPPYVAADDPHLSEGDVRFEPEVALVAGDDGLDTIRRLVRAVPDYLRPNGWLLLEHGYDQAASVRGLLQERGFADVESRSDLAGIERVTGGRWPESGMHK